MPTPEDPGDALTPEGSFRRRVRSDLEKLPPDRCKEYEGLRRSERGTVQEVARELDLWCHHLDDTLLVIREGDRAAQLRADLESIRPGEFRRFRNLDGAMQAFVREAATELHLEVMVRRGSKDELQIFNVQGNGEEFAAGVRRTLAALGDGETAEFPPALTHLQRETVGSIAGQLSLLSKVVGEGHHKQVAAGKLANFRARVCDELNALRPGEVRSYPSLSSLERAIVKEIATDKGCTIVCDQQDILSVRRTPDGDTSSIEVQIGEVFRKYASGRQGGFKIFLRKPDLHNFVGDARNAQRRDLVHQRLALLPIMEALERVYDDILDLQVDLGCRLNHGLILEYFQVFMSKASALFGWSLVGLLFALLEEKGVER